MWYDTVNNRDIFSVQTLEKAKATGNFAAETSDLSMNIKSDGSSLTSDSSDNESVSRTRNKSRPNKKMKLNGYSYNP